MHNALNGIKDMAMFGEYTLNEFAKKEVPELPQLNVIKKAYEVAQKENIKFCQHNFAVGFCKFGCTK